MKKFIFTLIFISVSKILFAQEVFLRLTDYGGGKINLFMETFKAEGSSTFKKNIEIIEGIIKYDLDYSLYFDIYSDTSSLQNPDKSGVVLQGIGNEPNLEIILKDLKSKEKIVAFNLEVKGELRSFAHKISDNIIETLTGEKGIASTKIVFSYKKGPAKELGLIDYDGYNFIPLTVNGSLNLFPTWEPSGGRILYSSYDVDRLVLNLLDLNTKSLRTISSYKGLNYAPDWSPDGTKVALTLSKDGNAEIYILDLENKKLNRLTYTSSVDCSPVFSPNGREIAFVSDRSGTPQIYIMDIYGGNLRRLTYHGNYNTSPSWSPRGDLIAYVSRQSDYSQQIFITDINGFQPVQVTFEGNNEDPSWSPDGLHIVFTSNRTGQYELWTMNWDGTRQRKLTNGFTIFSPEWSPFLK
ncbi:MAG: Tol-Pal system beta propeller repeat protein TolB [candidate division WOR-3 bacterium]